MTLLFEYEELGIVALQQAILEDCVAVKYRKESISSATATFIRFGYFFVIGYRSILGSHPTACR